MHKDTHIAAGCTSCSPSLASATSLYTCKKWNNVATILHVVQCEQVENSHEIEGGVSASVCDVESWVVGAVS